MRHFLPASPGRRAPPCPARRRLSDHDRHALGNAITITGDDGPNVISVNNVGNFIMYEDTVRPEHRRRRGCFQENPSLINCGRAASG